MAKIINGGIKFPLTLTLSPIGGEGINRQLHIYEVKKNMRIVRFELRGRTGYGIIEGEKISVLWGAPYDGGWTNTTGELLSLPQVTLLAPCEPSKIVALGLNYRDHAA